MTDPKASFHVFTGNKAYCPCCNTYQPVMLGPDQMWCFIQHRPGESRHPCDQCGSRVDVVYIPDPECGGVHAWHACAACRLPSEGPVAGLATADPLAESTVIRPDPLLTAPVRPDCGGHSGRSSGGSDAPV